jgi:hypothetical protein
MDEILQKCIKTDSYDIYKLILPLISQTNIKDLNKFCKIYKTIKKNYTNKENTINIAQNIELIKNALINWQNINVIINETIKVDKIFFYKTKLATLYYLIPKDTNISETYYKNQFNKIINIATTLEKFNKNKYAENGSVYIFPIEYSRTLNNKQFNYNSSDKKSLNIELKKLRHEYKALTISGQVFKHEYSTHIKKNSVFVIRNEECIKLFIHEYIHYLELDHINGDFVGNEINKIVSKFNIKLYGGSFECYTELLSNILNIMFFMLNNNINESFLNDLLKIEIIYSIYATSKLLYLYGYNSDNYQDFFNTIDTEKTIINNIPSAYYYITKSMYYLYFSKWIDLLDNNLSLNDNFTQIETQIINDSINKESFYMELLEKTIKIAEANNDLSLRYSIIDDNCNLEQKGGYYTIKNIKYKLYKYL